jgi:hypothetical protein
MVRGYSIAIYMCVSRYRKDKPLFVPFEHLLFTFLSLDSADFVRVLGG